MRKVLVKLWSIGSLASAHAWSSRDANSAVCAAWERPWVLWGSPAAAEAPKALPEENVSEGRGRGVVQMLSGAVLLFLIGGMPFLQAGWLSAVSFVYRDLLVPDDEDDEDHAVWRTGVYEHRPSEVREVREWEPVGHVDLILRTYFVPDGSDASDASDDELEL